MFAFPFLDFHTTLIWHISVKGLHIYLFHLSHLKHVLKRLYAYFHLIHVLENETQYIKCYSILV